MLGWPKGSQLAHAFLWKCSHKGLQLAQLLGQLGVFLTSSWWWIAFHCSRILRRIICSELPLASVCSVCSACPIDVDERVELPITTCSGGSGVRGA